MKNKNLDNNEFQCYLIKWTTFPLCELVARLSELWTEILWYSYPVPLKTIKTALFNLRWAAAWILRPGIGCGFLCGASRSEVLISSLLSTVGYPKSYLVIRSVVICVCQTQRKLVNYFLDYTGFNLKIQPMICNVLTYLS